MPKKRKPVHHITVFDAEILAVTSGRVSGEPKLFITVRPNPNESVASQTIAVSVTNGRRLLTDLEFVFSNSEWLR